ncbi:MAG: amino acid permease [Chitinophagales bacterium]|nr:amino acid permease [Chitinophagales bacterium]MDW8427010.1 amino acid permease [Chitinophagales bacterium]
MACVEYIWWSPLLMKNNQLFRRKPLSHVLQQVANGESEAGSTKLLRHLKAKDLVAFGIAAIIGAGVFSTIGSASAQGGPGVVLLFIFTALACSFAAFAYAEFASMVPVSGSAYTYSYVAFGELMAWFIGWALIMEYSVGNVTVAVSWSDYFTTLLEKIRIPGLCPEGIHLPAWAGMDFFSARRGYQEAAQLLAAGTSASALTPFQQTAYEAWQSAPRLAGLRLIADLPAIIIVLLITRLIYIGIRETRNASNIMVAIKLAVVILVIAVGFFFVDTSNWSPFLPNGIGGVLAGVSAVFFAYIGFDAISTTAEECVNPERDLPRGIIGAIVICTLLYILVALVLTGMVSYTHLGVGDPLAFVFEKVNMHWFSGIIAVSAVVAMASVLLVFQLGQPRIWLAMSRDGLLPQRFARIHPRYKTPSFATLATMWAVVIPTLLIPSDVVLDLCSMGTLFAFVLVCGGVLVLQNDPNRPQGRFRTPYINGRYAMPLLFAIAALLTYRYAPQWCSGLVSWNSFSEFLHTLPQWIFLIVTLLLTVLSYRHRLSLIPVLGLIFCLYMMVQIQAKSWLGFFIWLLAGLTIYFSYSYRHSNLRFRPHESKQ